MSDERCRKEILSIPNQIAHMKKKGIAFNRISEADARRFLENSTYYFKLKAYRKVYDKNAAGQYVDLDFAYLVDLSIIDLHLRKAIIKIALDVEHFLKVKLLRDFLMEVVDDGYEIVQEFFAQNPHVRDDIIDKGKSSYCADMISHYQNEFAIWNVIEVLSFGDFINLYELFYNKYSLKNELRGTLLPVKAIRNAAAHNNCIINRLNPQNTIPINPSARVTTFAGTIKGLSASSRSKKLSNPVIHDFVALLYVFDTVVTSEATKEKTYQELQELFNTRMPRNAEYYSNNSILASSYQFVKKIVDFLADQTYNRRVEQK